MDNGEAAREPDQATADATPDSAEPGDRFGDEDDAVVDAGSPQDYGEPNAGLTSPDRG